MRAGSRPSRLIPRARRDVDVWFLNGAIIAAAVVLFLLEVQHYDPIADPHIPWWALALMFAIGERCVVHVHFRRSAHSFSFGDVPLVFGLVFSSGPELVIAGLIGAAVPLVIDRQLPLVKTVFNLAQFALGAVVAELILHTITTATDVVHPSVWTGVLAAVEASALLSVGLIGAAIALS